MDRKSILDMAMGAFKERADYVMSQVIDNIADPNTRADKKRSLIITIDVLPDTEREEISDISGEGKKLARRVLG